MTSPGHGLTRALKVNRDVFSAVFKIRVACGFSCFLISWGLASLCLYNHFSSAFDLVSIISIVIGSSILFWLALAAKDRPHTQDQPPLYKPFSSMSDCISTFSAKMNFSATLLLQAHHGAWVFVNGWNASPVIGNHIAKELQDKVPADRQSEINVSVLDSFFRAICTPLHLPNGTAHVLVTLDSPIHAKRTKRELEMIVEFSWTLSKTLVELMGAPITRTSVVTSPPPVCCAVCDRVALNEGKWDRWGAWLHHAQGINTTHTVCQDCCEKIYGVPTEITSCSQ